MLILGQYLIHIICRCNLFIITIIVRSVLRVSSCQQQQVSGWHVIRSKHCAGKLHGHLANLYLRLHRSRIISKFSFIVFFFLTVTIANASSLLQCMQPPEPPWGSAGPPASWHKRQPSWTKPPGWQDGRQPPPKGGWMERWAIPFSVWILQGDRWEIWFSMEQWDT